MHERVRSASAQRARSAVRLTRLLFMIVYVFKDTASIYTVCAYKAIIKFDRIGECTSASAARPQSVWTRK